MLLKFDHLKVFSIIFFLMTFSFFPRQLGIEMQNTSDSMLLHFILFDPIIAYGNVNI
jgi:hypothetical protein